MNKNKTIRSSKRQQGGFILLQILIGISLLTILLAASIPRTIENAEQTVAEAATNQVFTLAETAQLYRARAGAWPDEANACAGAIQKMIDDGYLAGWYQSGATYVTAWNTELVTACAADNFTVSNTTPAARWAQLMAGRLPGAGIAGNTVTSRFPLPGGGAGASEDNYLFRVAVPGHPERNQMQTNLDMGTHDINNAGAITADTVNATTVSSTTITNSGTTTTGVLTSGTVNVNSAGTVNLGDNSSVVGGANVLINNTGAGSRIQAPTFRWGPDVPGGKYSELTTDQGGIELGGANGTTGFGKPYIDFHYTGRTEDYNSRIQADANGQLSITSNVLRASRDVAIGRNLNVAGSAAATDFILPNGKGLSQAVTSVFIADSGTLVSKPDCSTWGMVPRIYTSIAQVASGATAVPLYQVLTFASDNGAASWTVHMLVKGPGSAPAFEPSAGYGRLQVITKCEVS